jgi:hypothetical protein
MAAFQLSLSLLALLFAVSTIVSESRVARKDLGVDLGGVGVRVETGGVRVGTGGVGFGVGVGTGVGLGLGGSGSGVLNHYLS